MFSRPGRIVHILKSVVSADEQRDSADYFSKNRFGDSPDEHRFLLEA
ncbi:MAG: hypothetical protein AB2L14_36480 [Candidatus Xenobiia bacterium LiM19]